MTEVVVQLVSNNQHRACIVLRCHNTVEIRDENNKISNYNDRNNRVAIVIRNNKY